MKKKQYYRNEEDRGVAGITNMARDAATVIDHEMAILTEKWAVGFIRNSVRTPRMYIKEKTRDMKPKGRISVPFVKNIVPWMRRAVQKARPLPYHLTLTAERTA